MKNKFYGFFVFDNEHREWSTWAIAKEFPNIGRFMEGFDYSDLDWKIEPIYWDAENDEFLDLTVFW